jgi:predicted dehydrogenase
VPGRQVDVAITVLAQFSDGSIRTFEATRFGTGNLKRNSFEIDGSKGAIEFNLEGMNRLRFGPGG